MSKNWNTSSASARALSTEASDDGSILSSSSGISSSVHGNLMRSQTRRDPMKYYEIETVLGEGSMGFVARVKRKDSVRGGSARADFVKRDQRNTCCFRFLSFLRIPSRGKSNDIFASSESSPSHGFSGRRIDCESAGYTPDNPKQLTHQPSSLITYGTKKDCHFALKSIILSRCSSEEFILELKNEVEILKSLDHPNIVRALETYEFQSRMYIVLELCSGGDLYTRDPYNEEQAARIMSCLFKAISYMHSKSVVHRDLKYENIMFADSSPKAEVRIIDFGLSQKFAANEHLHAAVGTVYTMAPELINGDYDSKCDVWSLGAIAFMLLSSSMPFYGRDRSHIIKKILSGRFDFSSRRWRYVSPEGQAFVASLLKRNPSKRPVASEVLESPWLRQDFSTSPGEDQMDSIHAAIQSFSQYKTMKKLALMVVAYKSTSSEIGSLRKIFGNFDKSNDGEITLEEFQASLAEKYTYTDEEASALFGGIDIDGTGKVHYIEFLAATIESHGAIDEERLAEAFDRIDNDDSGYITTSDLKEFLGDDIPETYLLKVIDEADAKHDQRVSYDEFLRLWDAEGDEVLATAKINVGSRRVEHAAYFETTTSWESEDQRGGESSTSGSVDNGQSGSFYYQQEKDLSVRHNDPEMALAQSKIDSSLEADNVPPSSLRGSSIRELDEPQE